MPKHVVLTGLLILCLTGVALGRVVQWKPKEKPPVSLSEALVLADKEVAKKEGKFHCIGASLAKTFSHGDWELRYCSPEGTHLWVSVGSDRSVRLSAQGFER